MCPNPPSLQSGVCSVLAGRRAARKGRDLCVESISLTPEGFFCQEAKNIRERTFLCVADVVGEVGTRRRTRGLEEERGRLFVSRSAGT